MTHITKKEKTITHNIMKVLNNSWTNNKIEHELKLWHEQSKGKLCAVSKTKQTREISKFTSNDSLNNKAQSLYMDQIQPIFFFQLEINWGSKSNIVVYLKCLSEQLKPNFLVYGLISTKFFLSTKFF